MGNPIKYNELADRADIDAGFKEFIQHYKNLLKEAKIAIKGIKEATKGISPTAKDAARVIGEQSAAFKTQKKVVDESQKAINALNTAQQKFSKVQKQLKTLTDEEVKGKIRFNAVNKLQRDILKDLIILGDKQSGTLTRLNALNRQLRREREGLNLETKQGQLRVKEINSELDKNNTLIEKNSDRLKKTKINVGNYAAAILEAEKKLRGQETQLKQNIRALKIAATQTGRNTREQKKIQLELSNTRKKYGQIVAELRQYNRGQERSSQVTQNFTRVLGALGLLGGMTLVVRGMREMIGIFSGYEKQMAKVRAITRATDDEYLLLTNDSKRLGESTEKTATQVGELQLAFAKLGFTTPQIIAATEATLDLATATDEDLAQSALVAAKTIKGFNLSAEETARVTDVMALAFSSSALNLTAFQDAMKTVAPVALAVNSTLESTTAILSALVDSGLDASTAGTSLRNIFIELATQGLTWDEAMQQVRDSTNKVKTATELFGKRASTAALIIANNSEKIDTLTTSYENAAGSAKLMADIMRDTLTGDIDKATSAIQGMVIEIGEKLTPILRSIVQGFTFFIRNIGAFIKVILIATSVMISYRLGIKLATLLTTKSTDATVIKTLVEKISAVGQKALRGALLLTAAAQALATGNTKRATKAMRVFNRVTKLNPLGLLLGLLAAVAVAFFVFRDSTNEAAKAQDEFTGKHKDFLEQLAQEQVQLETLVDAALTAKVGTEERSFAITEINRLYGEYLPNLLTEASTLMEIAEAGKIANDVLKNNLAIKFKQSEITGANTKLIKAQQKANDFVTASAKKNSATSAAAFLDLQNDLKQVDEFFAKFPQTFDTEISRGEASLDLIDKFARSFGFSIEQFFDFRDLMATLREANKEAADSISESTTFYDAFMKSLGLTRKEIRKTTDELGSGIDAQKQKEIDLEKFRQRLRLAQAKNLEDDLKRAEEVQFEIFNTKKTALRKERDALIESLEKRQEILEEAGKAETKEFKEIEEKKIIIDRLFKQLDLERRIEFERIQKEQRIKILIKNEKEINSIALKELETSLLDQKKTSEEIGEEIGEEILDKKIELLEKEIVLRKSIDAEVFDQELELAKLKKKVRDKELEEEKKRQEALNELRDFGIDAAIKAIQRKADAAIKAADEEIAAVDKRISAQEALAAQGLENSLKFEQEQRAEALLAKLEAEKQKQRAEKISAFWNILSNSDSVQEAIAKFGIGEAFARTIEALPAFEEGGETPDNESIIRVSEKGSEYIVKHGPAQEYLPQLKAMNEGNYNPSEYIDNARFVPEKLPVNDMNIQLLTAEMRAVRDEIKNTVPRMESQFDAVTQSIINTYKWANRKKTIHYKLPSL